MERTLVIDCNEKIGETVKISGWVLTRRDHGKIVFLDISDRSGMMQVVVTGDKAGDLRSQDVVSITGIVNKRPEHLVNKNIPTGEIEISGEDVEVLSKASELPFDLGAKDLELQLPTLLDFRTLTLRHPKVKAIFKVQEALLEGFRKANKEMGCTEVFVPTISASATEGGAELFKFKYYGHDAFLVQSPQLYKQMMVGVFERVYAVSHIYRAEPSVTTRHLVESIQLDAEIGFIEKFEDVLDALEQTYSKTIQFAQESCKEQLALLEVEPAKVSKPVPRLTMREAQQIIFDRTGVDHREEIDLMPEDEKEIAAWALEEHDSDLVTITHFPTKKRAFYSMPDPKDPEYSLSFDLIFKGLEISSGAQRIHDYNQLVETIKSRGMDPKNFYMYLQAFEFGMPPHGGFSFGLERSTMKLLNLANIREASLFPRDMERVDIRLSKVDEKV
jgi:nondiscriminating aspartyl-tRNA synthetase